MSYGFEIRNVNDRIVVDGVNPNYVLVAAGTVATGTAVSFPSTDVTPLVFIRSPASGQYFAIKNLTSSSVTFVAYGSGGSASTYREPEVGSVEYRIYAPNYVLPPSGEWGVHLFDSGGRLCYDSNREIPRVSEVAVLGSLQVPNNAIRRPTSNVGHSSGATPWMMLNNTLQLYGYAYQGSGFLTQALQPCVRCDASGYLWLSVGNYTTFGTTGTYFPPITIPVPLMR